MTKTWKQMQGVKKETTSKNANTQQTLYKKSEMNPLKKEIHEMIRSLGWVTYPQLLRLLDAQGVEVEGDKEIRGAYGVILWGHLKEEVAMAIISLIEEKRLAVQTVDPVVYALEPINLSGPIVLSFPNEKLIPPDQEVEEMYKGFFHPTVLVYIPAEEENNN